MTEIALEAYLLSIGGVTRFDLKDQKLRRYLLHDIPFAVLDDSGILHMRLRRAKLRELTARYPLTAPSTLYDSGFWLALRLCGDMPDSAVMDALSCAIERILLTLPPLSRVLYTEKNPIAYDLDYKRILKDAEWIADAIDYDKRLVDIDDK